MKYIAHELCSTHVELVLSFVIIRPIYISSSKMGCFHFPTNRFGVKVCLKQFCGIKLMQSFYMTSMEKQKIRTETCYQF